MSNRKNKIAMLVIHNKKVIDYLCSKWNINEQSVGELAINFLEKDIAVYDVKYNLLGNYNLTPERRLALQNYINSL